jgi:hypothetical protein
MLRTLQVEPRFISDVTGVDDKQPFPTTANPLAGSGRICGGLFASRSGLIGGHERSFKDRPHPLDALLQKFQHFASLRTKPFAVLIDDPVTDERDRA